MSGERHTEVEGRWLTQDEQESWRSILQLCLLLPGRLDAQLQRDSGITLFEYMVLSWLSMSPERSLRMTELARFANGSLSRLSNVVGRLESKGWVTRAPLPEDGRVTVARLTDAGWDVVVQAAPGHVNAVRDLVVEPLTPNQLRSMGVAGERIAHRLDAPRD